MTSMNAINSRYEYGVASIRDLTVQTAPAIGSRRPEVEKIQIGDRWAKPTRRFWKSLFNRFAISDSVFRYFSHQEVFERIAREDSANQFRFCLEHDGKKEPRLLAASRLSRPVISPEEVVTLASGYDCREVSCSNGCVTTTHTPRSGAGDFQIGGDVFQHRYVLETPIDGFGSPRIYLSLLRMICANGAVAYSPVFRSEVSTGKDIGWSLSRALDSYDNSDGFAALRQRFESSQTSWASLAECNRLYRELLRIDNSDSYSRGRVLERFYGMTGRVHELYGMANLDALSIKRQRVLPARCRVYDLLNFATEIATHRVSWNSAWRLQGLVGSMLSDEFDMEGTAGAGSEFQDVFIESSDPGPRASLN
ncbi:MAG: hypothetical protein KDA79_00210 [Planctomycetaceae bacterium]|nr:hypothetical protein [Planctomycetaceae bacterium]